MSKTFSQIRLEQAILLITDEDKMVNELSVRCPYCGDSRNPRSAHLGIKFGQPSIYHCWICDVSGIVNARLLNDLQIDPEVTKKFVKWHKLNVYRSDPTIKEVSFNNNKEIYDFKTDEESKQYIYLKNRFGVDFTEEDIIRYRVILDPVRFLEVLNSGKKEKIETKVDISKYIGFLTQDGNQAVFRAIEKDQEPRYYNMTLEETNYRKLYVIDRDVDIKSEVFNFILTEGVFDLIGVHEKFFKDSTSVNNIYVAALGKSYLEPISRLIQSGFLNFNIMLYSDSSDDMDESFLEDLFRNEYIDEILLITNDFEGEKDFGVNINKIEPKEILLNRRNLEHFKFNNKKKD